MTARIWKKLVVSLTLVLLVLVWSAGLAVDSRLEKLAPQHPGGPMAYRAMFKGNALKVMALGYDHAVAVYYWLKTIQYCAYCGDHDIPMDNLYAMTEASTTLDPHFEFLYEMSWIFLMHLDVRSTEVLIEEGELILAKGWKNNPGSWRMAQNLAFHRFFYQQRYAEAANLYDAAYRLRPFVIYSLLAARLRAYAGDPGAALVALRMQLESTKDEEIRKQIKLQMKKVEAERRAWELDKLIERYKEEKNVTCPENLDDLIPRYLAGLPSDGLGGTYRLNRDECRAESTTIGRMEVYYSKHRDRWVK